MGSVKLNMAGVREVIKSEGVMSMLGDEASKVASRANSMARFRSPMDAEPYGASVRSAPYTAVGYVSARKLGRDGKAAVLENAAHNTLAKALRG